MFMSIFVLLLASYSYALEIDYYWRDYHGEIPADAFHAGIDASGKPIYIGQSFFQGVGLLPGTLHAGSSNLKATAGFKVHQTNKFVRILCTLHPQNFRWIHVDKHGDITSFTEGHVVDGGWETESILYVGRARHEGDLEIGKIYNLGRYGGLSFPDRQGRETDYSSFDLLTYDYYGEQVYNQNEFYTYHVVPPSE